MAPSSDNHYPSIQPFVLYQRYSHFNFNFSHCSAWIRTPGRGTMPRPQERTFQAEHNHHHGTGCIYKSHPSYGTYHLLKKDHRHPKARGDKFFLTTINCQPLILHATLVPTMQTSRRLRSQPPEGQARREVGSADSQEALPPPGFARESSTTTKKVLSRTTFKPPLCYSITIVE